MRGIFWSKQKKRWGYDVMRTGERYALYSWTEKEDAEKALRALLVDLDNRKPIPKNPLLKIINQYLVESAEAGRSRWRLDGLRHTFESVIIPYFGATTSFTSITADQVTEFVKAQKKTPVVRRFKTKNGIKEITTDRLKRNSTIDHYITDLHSLYQWAIQKPPQKRLADYNPVVDADLSLISNRKVIKPLFDPKAIEEAAKVLPFHQRVYYDFVRLTGSRKDEANAVEWDEHLFLNDRETAEYLVPGTKTPESAEYIPLPPTLVDELREWRKVCPSTRWAFPGQSAQTRGKRIYRRTSMLKILRKHGYKITVKDLRDYYANEVASNTHDAVVLMKLMRHKSLDTTTKYTRTIKNRMREAVNHLVVNRDCETDLNRDPQSPQNGTFEKSGESGKSDASGEPV